MIHEPYQGSTDQSVLVRGSLNRTKVSLKYIRHVIIDFETLSAKNFDRRFEKKNLKVVSNHFCTKIDWNDGQSSTEGIKWKKLNKFANRLI